jgi:hypothetical protein
MEQRQHLCRQTAQGDLIGSLKKIRTLTAFVVGKMLAFHKKL